MRATNVFSSLAVVVIALLAITSSPAHALSVTPDCHSTPALQQDCTKVLQQILDNKSVTELVLLPGKTYVTLPLRLVDRKDGFTISCPPPNTVMMSSSPPPRAILLAKRWAFNSTGATLLAVEDSSNINIVGACTFRMWRQDYANPKFYKHAEWRMALTLSTVTNVVLDSIHLEHSGGDGIYLTCSDQKNGPSRNVTIRHVLSKDNYRQGMSVICVDGLFVTNTVFEGTKGTPPQAGVDFEPNFDWQHQSNIFFSNVMFRNNTGNGLLFALHASTAATPNIGTWRFDNCTIDGGEAGDVSHQNGGIYIEFNPSMSDTKTNSASAAVLFSDITVKNTYSSGLYVYKGSVPRIMFSKRFHVENTAKKHLLAQPLFVQYPSSNIQFGGGGGGAENHSEVEVIDSVLLPRPFLVIAKPPKKQLVSNITGRFGIVSNVYGKCKAELPPKDECSNVKIDVVKCQKL